MTSRRSGHDAVVQLELPLGTETATRPQGPGVRHRAAPGGAGRPPGRTLRGGRHPATPATPGRHRAAAGQSGDGGGRLDAQTKQIGRQGIAAARARLAATAAATASGRPVAGAEDGPADTAGGRPVHHRGVQGHAA